MFGLQPHESVTFWWGARAIYKDYMVDIPRDRQQMTGGTDEERKRLADWVNRVGIKALTAKARLEYLSTQDDKLISFHDSKAGFFIMANPKESCGYLYITAAPISE